MKKLELFTKEDIPSYLEEINIEGKRFLIQLSGPNYTFPLSRNQILATMEDATNILFKFVNSETASILGYCQLLRIDKTLKQASIGRVLINKKHRGKGYSPLMLDELMEHSEEKMGLQRFSLKVYDFNKAAITCYQKLGFKEISRKDLYFENIDETWNCILMEKSEEL